MSGIHVELSLQDKMTATLNNLSRNVGTLQDKFNGVDATASSACNNTQSKLDEVDRKADSLSSSFKKLGAVIAGAFTIGAIKNWAGACVDACNVQIEAEIKLTTIMRQRMGATDDMIQSVKNLATAQQRIGVVGDEVQMAGAQQLATFLNTSESLNTLIPAMNNLAVQQNGVNVSSGSLVNIGNLMGKVMQGQTSALTRVGISFTEAQEKVLKFGNEQERASMLAQVITDNVGEMNQALRATPAGQIQSANNALGDMYENVGAKILPALARLYDLINQNQATIDAVLSGMAVAISVVIGVITDLADVALACSQVIIDNWSWIAPTILYLGSAFLMVESAIFAYNAIVAVATTVQSIYNGVLYACPLVWIVAAIAGVVAGLVAMCDWLFNTGDTATSVFGSFCGAINVTVALFKNMALEVANGALSMWYVMKAITSNIGTAFHNSIQSSIAMFYDLMNVATEVISSIADKLNLLPFVDIDVKGLNDRADDYAQKAQQARAGIDKYENVHDAHMRGATTYDTFNKGWAQDAWNAGNKWGTAKQNKLTDTFKVTAPDLSNKITQATTQANNNAQVANDIASGTEQNTQATKKSVDISKENLVYLRDIAERDAINKFTTAEIKVDMTNNNNVNSSLDINSVIKKLSDGVREAMTVTANGVY